MIHLVGERLMSSISLSPRDAVDLPSLKLYQHVSIDSLRFVLSVIFMILCRRLKGNWIIDSNTTNEEH